jgi:tRNA pseudouridine55 synthase
MRNRPAMETQKADSGGLLLVDKPAGMTSHDAVAIIRRAAGIRRVGHTGTLDPFATGLLVVLVGRGTRLIPYIEGEPKVYDAVLCLGVETDTDDATGTVTRSAALPSDVAIAEALARLTGSIEQMPPSYSAKKVAGVRSYDAARRGETLDLSPSRVVVHEWKLTGRNDNELSARVTCSGGTYVRALARDLGRYAGSAAHLAALRRVRSGPFDVADAASLDEIRAGRLSWRLLRSGVPSLRTQSLDGTELIRALHGNAVPARVDAPRVALLDDEERLIGIADRVGDELRPTLILRDA